MAYLYFVRSVISIVQVLVLGIDIAASDQAYKQSGVFGAIFGCSLEDSSVEMPYPSEISATDLGGGIEMVNVLAEECAVACLPDDSCGGFFYDTESSFGMLLHNGGDSVHTYYSFYCNSSTDTQRTHVIYKRSGWVG